LTVRKGKKVEERIGRGREGNKRIERIRKEKWGKEGKGSDLWITFKTLPQYTET
jgi:hypothetical protein